MSNKRRRNRRNMRKACVKTLTLRRRMYAALRSIRIYSIDCKPLSSSKNRDLFRVYAEHFDVDEESFNMFHKTILKGSKGREDVVYFIGNLKEGCVKIGHSSKVEKKLYQLKTGCPYVIEVLHTIPTDTPKQLENELHYKYRKHRLHGEWFKIEGKLEEYLKTVK